RLRQSEWLAARVKEGDDFVGQPRDLLLHHRRRDHRAGDELGASRADVLLEPLDEDLGWAERRALYERLVVDPAARDERRGGGVAGGAVGSEAEVDERAEVVGGNLAARLGGEGLDLLDTDAEALGRDERRDPAVAEPAGPNSPSCSTPMPTAGSMRPPER